METRKQTVVLTDSAPSMPQMKTFAGSPPEPTTEAASTLATRLTWLAVTLGVLLRIAQYAVNRSLWLDESYVALNLMHRTFRGLLQPLDYHQGAPVGFLLTEKWILSILGTSEYGLRFLPLIAGVASVLLFCALAKSVLDRWAVVIATGLFALCPSLIYYSSEVKQYSSDATLAILLLVVLTARREWSGMRLALLALVGAVAIWFSHPSVFVLAGAGMTITADLVSRRDWRRLARFSPVFVVWTASLAVSYLAFLRRLSQDRSLLDYWTGNFMPLPPRSVTDLKWFYDSFFDFFHGTVGMEFAGLAAFAFLVGSVALYRRSQQEFFFLISPGLLVLLASGLHKYPFGGRLALFLVPSALILIAAGAEEVRLQASESRVPVGGILAALLLLDPGVYVLHHFAKPHTLVQRPGIMMPEEVRPVGAYLQTHRKPGDVLYLFHDAQTAYQYYAERQAWPSNDMVLGTASGADPRDYAADLDRLRGHRAWILVSHIHGVDADEAKYIRFYLDSVGSPLETFTAAGAAAYLYDLTTPTSPQPVSNLAGHDAVSPK